jgi:hypothetical protein
VFSPALSSAAAQTTRNYAAIRIRHFRKPGLSADDSGVAVLNTAFWVF